MAVVIIKIFMQQLPVFQHVFPVFFGGCGCGFAFGASTFLGLGTSAFLVASTFFGSGF
jgi:hypothetical protein